MEQIFCVIFPTYKKTKYVQNNSHFKNLVIFLKSRHAVTKYVQNNSHFKNLVIFLKSCHAVTNTLLGRTGHIYMYVCPSLSL